KGTSNADVFTWERVRCGVEYRHMSRKTAKDRGGLAIAPAYVGQTFRSAAAAVANLKVCPTYCCAGPTRVLPRSNQLATKEHCTMSGRGGTVMDKQRQWARIGAAVRLEALERERAAI